VVDGALVCQHARGVKIGPNSVKAAAPSINRPADRVRTDSIREDSLLLKPAVGVER